MKTGLKIAAGLGASALVGIVLPRLFWFRRAHAPEGARLGTLGLRHGTDLAYFLLRDGHSHLVIVAHGFLKSKNLPAIVKACQTLAQEHDVLAFDFSGHGDSTGEARLDFARAARELTSVVEHARALGYEQVGVVGYSMGAAAAILAAAQGAPIQAVACVSTPAGPRREFGPSSQTLGRARSTKTWAWWARVMGTRVAATQATGDWPAQQIAAMPRIPLLLVHDGLDTLIRREDSEALFALANAPKRYLYVPRALHASPGASLGAICDFMAASLSDAASAQLFDELSAASVSLGKEYRT